MNLVKFLTGIAVMSLLLAACSDADTEANESKAQDEKENTADTVNSTEESEFVTEDPFPSNSATANILGTDEGSTIKGNALYYGGEGVPNLDISLTGAEEGKYDVHINSTGACDSTEYKEVWSDVFPEDIGDLGEIDVNADGTANAVSIYESDDLPNEVSKLADLTVVIHNAGETDRVACGVFEVAASE